MSWLTDAVLRKVREIGVDESAKFFGVSTALVRQWEAGSKVPSLRNVERVLVTPPEETEAVFTEANWTGKAVTLCLPWYRDVEPQTVLSLLSIFDRSKMGAMLNYGDAFIAHSRNTIAKRFIARGTEWSFWVDSDIVFPTGNAEWFNSVTGFNFPEQFAGAHTLNRLLSHGKTIVGGVYFGRSPSGRPLYAEGWADAQERANVRRGPRDIVKATDWVATGCLLVHRSVFLDITKKYPALDGEWFSTTEHDLVKRSSDALKALDAGDPAAAKQALASGLHAANTTSKAGTGEDVIFCRRAAQCGHIPHVDLGLICGHIGPATFGPTNTKEL